MSSGEPMTGLTSCYYLKRRARTSVRLASSHKLGRAFALASNPMNVFIGSLVSSGVAAEKPCKDRPGDARKAACSRFPSCAPMAG